MITLGTTFYNNPDDLTRFIDRNLPYVDELIVVDDGSTIPITSYVKPTKKLRLFRVPKDYGFNSHGCRNLIMSQTSNAWNILLDLDREFIYIDEAFKCIRNRFPKLDKQILYRFIAHADMEEAHVSVNDYMIHKDHFFDAGGYDEELIGERWGDREYFKQLRHYGGERVLHGVDILLTRKPSSYIGGVIKSPHDKPTSRFNVDLISRRIQKPDPTKPILTFEWEEITS